MGNSRILNKNFISTLLYYVTKEAISKYLQVVTNGAQMELTSYHTCRVIATFLPSFQFFLILVSLLFSFCLPPLLQHVQYILVLFSLHIYPLNFFPNLFI